jgi:iron complex outermembrane receptor protein
VGRAFRIPSFTERFYRDPAHEASAALDPEHAWTLDAAVDWIASPTWMVTGGAFQRRERDVIDWVRATVADRWQTTNIHRVRTSGLEMAAKRMAADGMTASLEYTWLSSEPAALDLLAKYTLDYARHSFVAGGGAPLGRGWSVGGRLDVRARTERDPYALLDLRVTRDIANLRLFGEVTNLFAAEYEEIRGVAMPGRWWSGGIEIVRW